MPVKRMPNQWFNKTNIDHKSDNESIGGEDNSYKSALNESVVDDLVSTLTNKLCLKTNHRLCRLSRLSPYQTHNSSTLRSQSNNSCYCYKCKYLVDTNAKAGLKRSSSLGAMSETYELMNLLKEGSLIKEAVKRIQYKSRESLANNKNAHNFYGEDLSDEDLDQNENRFNLLNA